MLFLSTPDVGWKKDVKKEPSLSSPAYKTSVPQREATVTVLATPPGQRESSVSSSVSSSLSSSLSLSPSASSPAASSRHLPSSLETSPPPPAPLPLAENDVDVMPISSDVAVRDSASTGRFGSPPWPFIILSFFVLIFNICTLGTLKRKFKRPPEIRVLPASAPTVESRNPSERATPTSTISRLGSLGFTWFSSNSSQDNNDERGVEEENGNRESAEWERSPNGSKRVLEDMAEANVKRHAANQRIRDELSRLQAWEQLRRQFSVQACTWNVSETEPPSSDSPAFREWLLGFPQVSSTEVAPELLPDMVVVTLQEVNMGGVVLVREQKTPVHQQWSDRILAALNQTSGSAHGGAYVCLRTAHLVGLMLMVFIKAEHSSYVTHSRVSLTRCGVMGVLGNKGALAFRTTLYGRRFLFVAAHFSAHKHNEVKRAKDYRATLSDLKFELPESADDEIEVLGTFLSAALTPPVASHPSTSLEHSPTIRMASSMLSSSPEMDKMTEEVCGNSRGPIQRLLGRLSSAALSGGGAAPATEIQILDQHDYIFFLGDLNSRLHGLGLEKNLSWIQDGRFDELLIHDELRQAMVAGEAFDGFEEPWIDFAPTYKYRKNSPEYDTSHHREPAWCDRILFRVGIPEERLDDDEPSHMHVEGDESRSQNTVSEMVRTTPTTTTTTTTPPVTPSTLTFNDVTPSSPPPPSARKPLGSGSGMPRSRSSPVTAFNPSATAPFFSAPMAAALFLISPRPPPPRSSKDKGSDHSPKMSSDSGRHQLGSRPRSHPVSASDGVAPTSNAKSISNHRNSAPSAGHSISVTDTLAPKSSPVRSRVAPPPIELAHNRELSTFSAFRASRGSFSSPGMAISFSATTQEHHHVSSGRLDISPRNHHQKHSPPCCRFPNFINHVQPKGYASVEALQQSDHRPVSASFTVEVIHFPNSLAEKMWDVASVGLL